MKHGNDRICQLLRGGGCLFISLLALATLASAEEAGSSSPSFFHQSLPVLQAEAGAILQTLLPAPVDPEAASVSDVFRDTYPPQEYIHHRLGEHAILILPRRLLASSTSYPANTPVRVTGAWTPSDPFEPTAFALVALSYQPLRAPAPLSASPYPDGYATPLAPDAAPLERIPASPFVRIKTALVRKQAISTDHARRLGLGAGAWFRVESEPSAVSLLYSDHTVGLSETLDPHLGGVPVTVYGRLFTLCIPDKPDRVALLIDGVDPQAAPVRPDPSTYTHRSKTILREVIALPMLDTMEIDYVYHGHEHATLARLSYFQGLHEPHIRLFAPGENFMGDRIDVFLPAASRTLVAELELAEPGDTLILRCRRISGTDLRHALLIEDIQRVPLTHTRSP